MAWFASFWEYEQVVLDVLCTWTWTSDLYTLLITFIYHRYIPLKILYLIFPGRFDIPTSTDFHPSSWLLDPVLVNQCVPFSQVFVDWRWRLFAFNTRSFVSLRLQMPKSQHWNMTRWWFLRVFVQAFTSLWFGKKIFTFGFVTNTCMPFVDQGSDGVESAFEMKFDVPENATAAWYRGIQLGGRMGVGWG